jgi:hypothetical protein
MPSGADLPSRVPVLDHLGGFVKAVLKLEDSLLGVGILLVIGWLVILGTLL